MEVQYWNTALGRLEHPQKLKIRKFLEHGCIVKVDSDTYNCLPLLGYNTTTYTLRRKTDGGFRCNCQGYNKRNDCSHTQALYLLLDKDDRQAVLF